MQQFQDLLDSTRVIALLHPLVVCSQTSKAHAVLKGNIDRPFSTLAYNTHASVNTYPVV